MLNVAENSNLISVYNSPLHTSILEHYIYTDIDVFDI